MQTEDSLPSASPEGEKALAARIEEMQRILPGAMKPVVVHSLQDILDVLPDDVDFDYVEGLKNGVKINPNYPDILGIANEVFQILNDKNYGV